MSRSGTLLCLASGAAFGGMGVFGKLAYENGATLGTLLSARFALAAAIFWLMPAVVSDGALRMVRRRDVVAALALGGGAYAAQAGAYFTALARIEASLLSLLVYTYPALVAAGAALLRRERPGGRRLPALALASGGVVLVVAGAGTGALDPLGAALAVAAATVYAVYILAGEGVARRMPPLLLAALVCTGTAVTLGGGALALGELRPGEVTAAGWGWLACLAAVSTVAAIALFFAGLRRVGPTAAAILSTVEPLVTVVLAFLAFGERLGPVQLLGGALVLAAVVVLQAPRRRLRGARGPASSLQ